VTLLGVFEFGADGWIMGLKYFRDGADDANHFGLVFNPASGELLRTVSFRRHVASAPGPAGWETAYLHPRLAVAQFDLWSIGIFFQSSYFWYDAGALSSNGFLCNQVQTIQDNSPYPNMQFSYTSPTDGFTPSSGTRYGIDILFLPK
jgi:hypothetical protein